MARYLFSQGCFLSAIYCGGYSGEDPPLPIPNREVKLTIADGTDLPVGRVGSRRFRKPDRQMTTGLLRFHYVQTQSKNFGYRRPTPRRYRGRPRGGPPPLVPLEGG